jgi:hypothetical protein
MVQITLLILLHRLRNGGFSPVLATRVVAADGPTLRVLVSDPASQWRLVSGVSSRLRPQAYVEPTSSSRLVTVRVQLRGRDALWITWIFSPGRGTTEVDLAAQVESRGLVARIALLLGGRIWLRHRLESTLGELAQLAICAAEDLTNFGASPTPVTRQPRKGAGMDTFGPTSQQGTA